MTATKAFIAHRIPGRIRLMVSEKRGDVDYFAKAHDAFTAIDNVRQVSINPNTGSIVLEFTGELPVLLKQLKTLALCDVVTQPLLRTDPSQTQKQAREIHLVTGRDMNSWFMSGMAFVMLGIFQTMRGQVFVPAMTAFWYAKQAFFRSTQSETRSSLEGE